MRLMSTRYSSAEIREWIRRIDKRSLYAACNEWERGFLAVVRAKLEAREHLTAQQAYHLERIIIHSAPLTDASIARAEGAMRLRQSETKGSVADSQGPAWRCRQIQNLPSKA